MNPKLNEETVKNIYIIIGKRIKHLRCKEGISQSDLAFRCNTDASKIGKTERGQHELKFTTILAIAKAFNMKIEELLPLNILNEIIENLWKEK